MARKLDYRWHLRQVMASRGMFATTDLIEPLAARGIRLSSSQVYRLVAERPERLSLKILMALLDILDCSMTDLIEPVAAGGRSRAAKAAGGGSGRGRPVAAQAGPHHHPGRRVARMICSICGRNAPCEISQATGRPWCKACQKRRARCAGCGQVELIRGGTIAKPLCAACTRPDPAFWRGCPACGHPQLSTRSCTRCNLRQRLQALLADHDGDVRAELRGLHDNLASSDRPNLVLAVAEQGRHR